MKAAVLETIGKITIKEVNDPEPGPGGLIIAVKACGICSSDVKMWRRGQRDLRYPRILGHEVSGTVMKSRSEGFKEGERVQIFPGVSCGSCHHCKTGRDNLCSSIRIIGFSYDGGFAELMKVPREIVERGGVNRIPGKLSFEEATLAEPLACCINCVEKLGLSQEDTVLILGAGTMGLLNIALAKLRGARVIVAEKRAERQEYARLAGADRVVDANLEDVRAAVQEETEGRGVDAIVPAFGRGAVSYPVLELLSRGGRLCLFSGLPTDESAMVIDFNAIHYDEKLIVGAYGCTSRHNRVALGMIEGELDLKWFPIKCITLDEVEEGLRAVEEMRQLKLVIRNR